MSLTSPRFSSASLPSLSVDELEKGWFILKILLLWHCSFTFTSTIWGRPFNSVLLPCISDCFCRVDSPHSSCFLLYSGLDLGSPNMHASLNMTRTYMHPARLICLSTRPPMTKTQIKVKTERPSTLEARGCLFLFSPRLFFPLYFCLVLSISLLYFEWCWPDLALNINSMTHVLLGWSQTGALLYHGCVEQTHSSTDTAEEKL